MPLVSLRNIQVTFGGPPLLDSINFNIDPGERICLIGRNGTGKSTLMRVIMGEIKPDDGVMQVSPELKVARLTQDVPDSLSGSVFDVVAGGLEEVGELIKEYHHLSHELMTDCSQRLLDKLARVQHELEANDGWQMEQRVEQVISRLSLDPDIEFTSLSGGLKRRVLLARALALQPDLLLLDEPTNHLDIESIEWLEEFLAEYSGSLLFITHDRRFLRRLATRIVEIDRGSLTDWPGDYDNFLRRKDEMLNAEALENARFDKKLAAEEVWIRQGIKARRTRNEGRVRDLESMRNQRSKRREKMGTAQINLDEAERSGKLVMEAKNISFSWDDQVVVKDFSTVVLRGDKIGVIGPNGVGKTTLLKILLGDLSPTSGSIRLGTRLEVAYFDQLRAGIDDSKSVQDNVSGGSDSVTVNGTSKHVISYLRDFLFTPERARSPVKMLSGGERNRLLLAKLFTKPANVLVMDEPTNDLDAETLDLLEELLLQYQGTLLLVSHDRDFINNLVTSCFVFEGNGRVNEYVGGYDDWLRQRKQQVKTQAANKPKLKASSKVVEPEKKKAPKLSFKDQYELDELPKQVEALENRLSVCQEKMAQPDFFQQEKTVISDVQESMQAIEAELAIAYERWEALEAKLAG